MLTVRVHSLLPVLRRRVWSSTLHTSLQRSLRPQHLPICSTALTRNFSQQNDNSESFLHRLKNSISDAAQVIAEEARGADLTDDEATTLLSNFAKQRRIDDCVGLLRYCREQHVTPELSTRTAAFRTLCDAKEFAAALQLYRELSRDGVQLKPWMVGRALEVATKAKRLDVVMDIFQQFVDKNKGNLWTATGVHDLVTEANESGYQFEETALRAIAIFADRAGNSKLAMEILSLTKNHQIIVTPDLYASVLEACGKSGDWENLVKVYEEMPESFREKLYSRPLGLVVRAHTRSEREEMVLRGLEIFQQHKKGKWSIFPCDAALEAFLQTKQFDKVIELAEKMKQKNVERSEFTYKMITLAYIGNNSAEKAKNMLFDSAIHLEDGGVESYRELVNYFLKEKVDNLQACQVYVDMMHTPAALNISDWINALNIALELTDRSMYWHFRKALQLCGKSTEALIPSHLLLSVQEDLEHEVALQEEDIQIAFSTQKDGIVSESLISVNDVEKSSDVGKNEKELSTFLTTFAKNRRFEECEELLRYCQELNLSLDKSSQSAAFRSFCDAGRFEAALQLFDVLSRAKIALRPWVYGRALEAAVKLNRNDLVLFVFRRLLDDPDAFKDYTMKTSGKMVHEMLCQARDRGTKLSSLALRSLSVYADRFEEAQLAQDILAIMQQEERNISLDVYGSVLNTYGLNERWDDLLRLYESMPENLRSQLHGTSLSWVITATSSTDKQLLRSSDPSRPQVKTRPAPVSDVSLVRDRFEEIKANDGLGLTDHVASTLMGTMAKHKRVYDCAEMLRYFNKHNVSLKPFAALSVFNLFCETQEFLLALEVFENLYESTCVLKPWVFGWALDAASNLDRQDLISSIFQRLLKAEGGQNVENFQLQPNENGVYGMLFDVCERGVNVSRFAFEALLSFADKSCQSDLALDVLTMMLEKDMKLSIDTYGMVLVACGKNEQWNDAMQVFEQMPTSFYSKLSSAVLGSVVMTHTQTNDEELIARGLELFDDHKAKWSTFACNAALDALLQLQKFDDLFTLASDMKRHKVKWTPFTYNLVILGHLRSGSIGKARRLLQENNKRLQNESASCYEELIEYYANTVGETLEALQLCEEMMQNNWHVTFAGWHTALKLSFDLPDRTAYWRIRKQLWLRGEPIEQTIPSHLLLLERDFDEENGEIVGETSILPADVSLASEVFEDIWNAGGSGLTVNVATKLLMTMAQYQCVEECLELLNYFEEHRVTPKPFARVAAFRTLCDANQEDRAMKLLGEMLSGDVILDYRDCSVALKTAMKMKKHEVRSKIMDHMRIHHTTLSRRDYENIRRKYGREED